MFPIDSVEQQVMQVWSTRTARSHSVPNMTIDTKRTHFVHLQLNTSKNDVFKHQDVFNLKIMAEDPASNGEKDEKGGGVGGPVK